MAREGRSDAQGLEVEGGEDRDDDDDVADIPLLTPTNTPEKNGLDEHDKDRADDRFRRQLIQQPAMRVIPADSVPADPQSTNPGGTFPPTRRSTRARRSLMYDQKYHPMDDFIRPSQAAKRRSIHGMSPIIDEDLGDETSEGTGSEAAATVHNTDDNDNDAQKHASSRKRKRSIPWASKPTRRSMRRKMELKVSYDMSIHPQDSDLNRAYAFDGSDSSPSPNMQANDCTATHPGTANFPQNSQEECQLLLGLAADVASPEPISKPEQRLLTRKVFDKEPTRKRAIKIGDVYPDLHPDITYLTGNQNPWPEVKELPFCMYTDHIEDQLNAEAEAASPYRYEDDDKENAVTSPELVPNPNPLDGISIIPASYLQNSIASNAFYSHPQFEALPYGLGWSEGDLDRDCDNPRDCNSPDYMRILASGESLPRESTHSESPSQVNDASVSSSPAQRLSVLDLRR
ncbi:hypothetical protein SVAN01_04226 [Stagonosporopsis vannaccii]|nr:hypothetical protein SVAN01_04226 [Stagonosporopsis vannaccii]